MGDPKQLLHEQQADQFIQQVVRYLEAGHHPARAERKDELPNTVKLMHEWHKLFIDKRGLLCRMGTDTVQVVLPATLKALVLRELHTNMGHLGTERVLELVHCLTQRRSLTLPQAPLSTITSAAPLELISLDFVHLETSSGGYAVCRKP